MSAAILMADEVPVTIRHFKEFVMKEAGVSDHNEFVMLSDEHLVFFDKLNILGWEKRTKQPEETQDVDATALLTNDEWNDLMAEFRQLYHGT